MKTNVLLVAIALSCFLAGAQDRPNAKLKGLVTDVTGAWISGARVLLVDLEAVDAARALSDKEGKFEFGQLHAGREYELRLQAPGFNRLVRRIELKPGDNQLDFKLNVGWGGGVEVQGVETPKPPKGGTLEYGIQGTVIDGAGAVVPGANLLLIPLDGSEPRKTKADAQGLYIFRNLQPGGYEVIAGNPHNSRCFQASNGHVELKPTQSYVSLSFQLKISERRCPVTIEVSSVQLDQDRRA
jgi:hypothetical protein